MTPERAFEARELHAAGLWSGRIADLLGVEESIVRRALNGETFDEREPEPRPSFPVEKPEVRADPDAWPPPADESTVWTTVRPVVPRTTVRGAEVRVREVMLWGKPVLINQAGDVFCDWCHHAFRTTAQLGHPRNGCPVGIIRPHGVIYAYDPDEDADPEWTNRPVGIGMRDLMREPW